MLLKTLVLNIKTMLLYTIYLTALEQKERKAIMETGKGENVGINRSKQHSEGFDSPPSCGKSNESL
jgi:hypothetical protein